MKMKTTERAYQRALKLEHELAKLTETLAISMREPVSRRDLKQLADDWLAISRMRPQLHTLGRRFNKIEKPARGQVSQQDYAVQRKIYEQARKFKKRLGKWDEIEHIVKRHLAPVTHPLLPPMQPVEPDDLLNRVYEAFHRLANPSSQASSAQGYGCFADIAFPIKHFENLMSAAYRISLAQNPNRSLRFIDVGCGGGTKIFAATRFFQQVDGLDYDEGYTNAATETLRSLGISNSKIFHADALKFDSYSNYDVIYFYRPMQSDTLLEEMEQRVVKTARPGTILVMPYNGPMHAREGIECAHITGSIFVTGISQPEADQLRLDAEATSTEVLVRSARQAYETGYWAPVLDAASC